MYCYNVDMIDFNEISLVVVDIDGTLTDGKYGIVSPVPNSPILFEEDATIENRIVLQNAQVELKKYLSFEEQFGSKGHV